MMSKHQHPVVICGLFRNGTSLLTYLLTDVLDYAIPPGYKRANGESSIEVQAANKLFGHFHAHPATHWQLKRMLDYPTWDVNQIDVMVNIPRNQEPLRQVKQAIETIVAHSEEQERQWYIKGTRLPLQLPFWYPHLPSETRYIVPYRYPLLAGQSMLKHGERYPFFSVIRDIEEAIDVYNLYYSYLLNWLDLHPELNIIGLDYNEWYTPGALSQKLSAHLTFDVTEDMLISVFKPTRPLHKIQELTESAFEQIDLSVYRRLQKL